jgi:hypothetical protein
MPHEGNWNKHLHCHQSRCSQVHVEVNQTKQGNGACHRHPFWVKQQACDMSRGEETNHGVEDFADGEGQASHEGNCKAMASGAEVALV